MTVCRRAVNMSTWSSLMTPTRPWRLPVELANSALEPDTLTTPADLTRFFARHGYTGRHDGDAAELGEVRGIRETLRASLAQQRR